MAVRNDLRLDMPRPVEAPLQEDHAAAERPRGLLPRALVSLPQLVMGAERADAAAAAARSRLKHQRITDTLRLLQRLRQGAHGAAAPRRDRNSRLLGEPFRADLVPEPAHRLRARADEGHIEPFAQLGERRVLGNEAPACPGRVRAGLDQRPLQRREVQVRPGRCRSQAVAQVRFAHEGGVALRFGVQRDRLERRAPLGREPLGIELPHRVNQPTRSFTSIYHGNPREHDYC